MEPCALGLQPSVGTGVRGTGLHICAYGLNANGCFLLLQEARDLLGMPSESCFEVGGWFMGLRTYPLI